MTAGLDHHDATKNLAWWSDVRKPTLWAAPGWLAWASVVVAAILHVYAAWGAKGPVIAADEVGNLGIARVLSGTEPQWELAGAGFAPGLGALIAPAWWISSDPMFAFYFGLGWVVVLAVASIWPLSLIARHVGAPRTTAVVVAAVILASPARTIESNYVISESLLLFVTAWSVVLAMRLQQRPTVSAFAAFGAVAGLTFVAHGRGVAIVAGAGIWMLLWLRRNRSASLVGGLALTVVSAAGYVAFGAVADVLYRSGDRVSILFGGVGQPGFGEYLGTAIGTMWYAVGAWPAVAVVGLGWLLMRSKREAFSVFLLVSLGLSLAMSVVQVVNPQSTQPRIDFWFYGRYVDHLLTVVAVIGVTLLLRFAIRRSALLVVGVSGAVSVAFLTVTVPRIPTGGEWASVHVAGVAHYLDLQSAAEGVPQQWTVLVLASLAVTLLVLAASQIGAAALLLLSLYWIPLSLALDSTTVDLREDPARVTPFIESATALVPFDVKVGFDERHSNVRNVAMFGLAPREVVIIDLEEGHRDLDFVMENFNANGPPSAGALAIRDSQVGTFVVWVYPGSYFDDLSAQGALYDPQADTP